MGAACGGSPDKSAKVRPSRPKACSLQGAHTHNPNESRVQGPRQAAAHLPSRSSTPLLRSRPAQRQN
ncbi:hypothetical protein P7K49_030995, partial [Saguinus oedipus]